MNGQLHNPTTGHALESGSVHEETWDDVVLWGLHWVPLVMETTITFSQIKQVFYIVNSKARGQILNPLPTALQSTRLRI